MTINGKTVLVTGANRGIGQALVTEALARGASRVYAGTRQPLAHPDPRVTPLTLDVTDAAQIQAAVGSVESLDILINNAGIALYDDLSDRALLEQHLAVNLFGTYGVTQAFLPLLTRLRRSPWHEPSSTGWRTARRKSSPIPCRSPWPTAGGTARSRRWSARTRRSWRQSPPRHRPLHQTGSSAGTAVPGPADDGCSAPR